MLFCISVDVHVPYASVLRGYRLDGYLTFQLS